MIGRGDTHATSTPTADDCETYLSGTYLDTLLQRRAPIPTWAWLNPLAHQDLEHLTDLAAKMPGDGPVWTLSDAVAWLAREMLGIVGDDAAALHRLQQDILIPLEGELAADDIAPLPPHALVQLVMAALG